MVISKSFIDRLHRHFKSSCVHVVRQYITEIFNIPIPSHIKSIDEWTSELVLRKDVKQVYLFRKPHPIKYNKNNEIDFKVMLPFFFTDPKQSIFRTTGFIRYLQLEYIEEDCVSMVLNCCRGSAEFTDIIQVTPGRTTVHPAIYDAFVGYCAPELKCKIEMELFRALETRCLNTIHNVILSTNDKIMTQYLSHGSKVVCTTDSAYAQVLVYIARHPKDSVCLNGEWITANTTTHEEMLGFIFWMFLLHTDVGSNITIDKFNIECSCEPNTNSLLQSQLPSIVTIDESKVLLFSMTRLQQLLKPYFKGNLPCLYSANSFECFLGRIFQLVIYYGCLQDDDGKWCTTMPEFTIPISSPDQPEFSSWLIDPIAPFFAFDYSSYAFSQKVFESPVLHNTWMVYFDEVNHKYAFHNRAVDTSVTSLLERVSPCAPFDADAVSLRIARGNKVKASQLREDWSNKAKEGTGMHLLLEKICKGMVIEDYGRFQPEVDMFNEFVLPEMRRMGWSLDGSITEPRIWLEVNDRGKKSILCGSVDLVLKRERNGEVEYTIWDWKRINFLDYTRGIKAKNTPITRQYFDIDDELWVDQPDVGVNQTAMCKYSRQLWLYRRFFINNNLKFVDDDMRIVKLNSNCKGFIFPDSTPPTCTYQRYTEPNMMVRPLNRRKITDILCNFSGIRYKY